MTEEILELMAERTINWYDNPFYKVPWKRLTNIKKYRISQIRIGKSTMSGFKRTEAKILLFQYTENQGNNRNEGQNSDGTNKKKWMAWL